MSLNAYDVFECGSVGEVFARVKLEFATRSVFGYILGAGVNSVVVAFMQRCKHERCADFVIGDATCIAT